MSKRFALIGAGLTGTSFLWQLAQELESSSGTGGLGGDVCIEVFDRHAQAGPGLPHNGVYVLPCHITNMCAGDMGIAANRPRDFQDWLDAQESAGVLKQVADPAVHGTQAMADSECRHYPRSWMGHYLADRFSAAVTKLEAAGIRVMVHTRCEVVDLQIQEHGFALVFRDEMKTTHSPPRFDRVLLATGHWFPAQSDRRVIPSPWPAARLLAQIPPSAEVAVLGSSLSAIETALTLSLDGYFARSEGGQLRYHPGAQPRRLTLFSRRGQLPRVRGRLGTRPNQILNSQALERLVRERKGVLSLAELFSLLEQELRLAYGPSWSWQAVTAPEASATEVLRASLQLAQQGDGPQGEVLWQTVLAQALPWAHALYLALAPEERRCFDRDWTTLFFLHVATQPASNAEKLLALADAGLVRVVALGEGYRVAADDQGVTIEGRGKDAPQRWRMDWLVDARGQPGAYARCEEALPRALVARGEFALTEGRFAGLRIDPASLEVLRPDTRESASVGGIYAIGTMTRSQMLDASMARGLVVAAARVSAQIARWLHDGDRRVGGSLPR